jgi:hypothetical protein
MLSVFAFAAAAADVTGKWSAETPGRDGNKMTNTFDLKASGSDLTGTITTARGEMPISDGKVDGDNISFSIVMNMGGNEMKMVYKGKVEGDQIKFTREREGGGGRKQEFVAKRAGS